MYALRSLRGQLATRIVGMANLEEPGYIDNRRTVLYAGIGGSGRDDGLPVGSIRNLIRSPPGHRDDIHKMLLRGADATTAPPSVAYRDQRIERPHALTENT